MRNRNLLNFVLVCILFTYLIGCSINVNVKNRSETRNKKIQAGLPSSRVGNSYFHNLD